MLDACVKELNGNVGRWASIPGAAQHVGQVNSALAVERLLLSVEQRVLREHFDAQFQRASEGPGGRD